MLSKTDARKKVVETSGDDKFLSELETISESLYADKTVTRLAISTASSRSNTFGRSRLSEPKMKSKESKNNTKDPFDHDKKSSIWSWKGFKALTNTRNRRLNCCFSVAVHSIEGLPSLFNDVCLVVHWKRQDGEQMTNPIRVSQGAAEFEQQLAHCCSVYGSRSGPHHSAKYEAKHCLLYASVYDTPVLDLGKHRVDLTRLLPLSLEELEEEKSSGKWTTSFRLSGKARGATMNVSFGYVVVRDDNTEIPSLLKNGDQTANVTGKSNERNELSILRTGSLPGRSTVTNGSTEDIKDLHEVLPISKSELCDVVNILYQKLDEEISNASVKKNFDSDLSSSPVEDHKMDYLRPPEKNCETNCEISEFSITDKGIEEVTSENKSSNVAESSSKCHKIDTSNEDFPVQPLAEESVHQCDYTMKESDVSSKESLMKELKEALTCASDLVNKESDSQDENNSLHQENYWEVKSHYRDGRKENSFSLDDVTDSVASEFLEMLGIENSPFGLSSVSEPESPRERLLRQFEEEALASGGLINFEMGNDPTDLFTNLPFESPRGTISEDFNHSSIYEGLRETFKMGLDEMRDKTKAIKIEDLETEALMREWGLNEKAFQHSPPDSAGGFGSPISTPPEDPQELPPLSEGLGPFMQTKNGGFLRSMNPDLFRNAKSGGSLIMQVSNPVVVPAEMGSDAMDILQGLASVGIEKLSMQANKLMPLEDITGMTIQQIVWEAAPCLEGPNREGILLHDSEIVQNIPIEQKSGKVISSSTRSSKFDSSYHSNDTEYVSLEDLAPLAMDKIEALSIEGLRIHSGMSDNDAPSNISTQSIGELSALKGKTVNAGGSIGLDGTGGLQLLDMKDNGEDIDGLMGLSLSLDEWMKLDSGEIDDDDLFSERTSKILAAHHATSLEVFRGRSKGEKRRGMGRKYGLLGNNFTFALMVQLRDPLRNYEPVGSPMLALIQVERVFIPPKPKIHGTFSLLKKYYEEEEEAKEEIIGEKLKEEKVQEETIPQYKITEVYVAGLKTEPAKKKLWGSEKQQQSGSRWLLANGMGKKNKHPLMKSKAMVKPSGSRSLKTSTTVQPGDTLWSISSRVHGTGNKWNELAALNPHIRNPNLVLPLNETIR